MEDKINLLKSIFETTWKRFVLYLIIGIIIFFLMGMLFDRLAKSMEVYKMEKGNTFEAI